MTIKSNCRTEAHVDIYITVSATVPAATIYFDVLSFCDRVYAIIHSLFSYNYYCYSLGHLGHFGQLRNKVLTLRPNVVKYTQRQ